MNFQSIKKYGWLLLLVSFSFWACKKEVHPDLFGKWRIDSKFYTSTCEIVKENGQVKGKVLYYYDGTTQHRHSDKKVYYYFENLVPKDSIYVDGISGATQLNDENINLSIKIIHKDSLQVSTYIRKKPVIEKWIRIDDKQ
jgi:hypothetical protein